MTALKRRRISIRLCGPSFTQIDALRRRIKESPSRTFVYMAGPRATRIELANHEIEGRADLLAVYDRSVTNGMLRADLYGEEA